MNKPMTVYVDQSAVGIGKTYNALNHIMTFPARYIFVTERQQSVREIEERARAMAYHQRVTISLKTVMSSEANRGTSVATEVAALPFEYANDAAHVCVIITHSAMMSSDLSGFSGWHIVIDEVPNILTQQPVRSKTDRDFFDRNYRLKPLTADWSKVTLTDVGKELTSGDLSECESHGYLRGFHQRVSSGLRPVLCDLQNWEQMTRPNVSWTWWSIFNVRQLEAFRTVRFLGSGFMSKLAAKMLQNFDPDVVWLPTSRTGDRRLTPKVVRVHYFTDAFASRYYFESDHGQEHLGQIARYLRDNMPAASIWSANDPAGRLRTAYKAMRPHMGNLRALSPKQAGSSEFMAYHDAAMIYASRPSSSSKAILKTLGCTEQDWIETNEYETVLQFVTRTSVRDITVGGTTNFYVLSRDQAQYLMKFFDAQPHITAEIHHIDLCLQYPTVKRGRPPEVLTPAEAAEKIDARKKAKARAERERRALAKAKSMMQAGTGNPKMP